MKRVKSHFYLLLLLVVGIVGFSSCSKDEEEQPNPEPEVTVGVIKNIDYTVTQGDVMLVWEAYENAKSYMVYVGDIAESDNPITSNAYNVGTLVDGIEIKVEAFSDYNMSSCIGRGVVNYVEPVVVESPDPVENLVVVEEGDGFVSISWDNPDCTFSWVEIYDGPRVGDDISNRLESPSNVNDTDQKLMNLTNEQTYTFYVYTRNLANQGTDKEFSEAVTVSATPTDGSGGGVELPSLEGTMWKHFDQYSSEYDMKLSFNETTVVLHDGTNHYLNYTYDAENLTGVIDPGGYYEDEFTISSDLQNLNCYNEDFDRLMK